jgi:hypothetical protein
MECECGVWPWSVGVEVLAWRCWREGVSMKVLVMRRWQGVGVED